MAKPKDRSETPADRALKERMRKLRIHNEILAKSGTRYVPNRDDPPKKRKEPSNHVTLPYPTNKKAKKAGEFRIAVAMLGNAQRPTQVHAGQGSVSTAQKFNRDGHMIMTDGHAPTAGIHLSAADLEVLAAVRNKSQKSRPANGIAVKIG